MALLLPRLEQHRAKDDEGNDDDDEPFGHDGLGTRAVSPPVAVGAEGGAWVKGHSRSQPSATELGTTTGIYQYRIA